MFYNNNWKSLEFERNLIELKRNFFKKISLKKSYYIKINAEDSNVDIFL